jgi:hypothetical protein
MAFERLNETNRPRLVIEILPGGKPDWKRLSALLPEGDA